MEILSQTELKKVLLSVDGYNDDNLETFSDYLTDYCDEITTKELDQILIYIEDDMEINVDSELKNISESQIVDLCDFINELF